MNTNSDINIQAATVSSITEVVANSGDRAPAEIASGVGGAVEQAQVAQTGDTIQEKQTKKNSFKSAVDKWKQEFAKNMLQQPDGQRQKFIEDEHRKLVQQFNTEFSKAGQLDEAAKRKRSQMEAKLNALKQIIRELNDSNYKRNAQSGNSKKERKLQKQVVEKIESFDEKPKSKKAKKKQSQELTKLLLQDRSELPRGPTGKTESDLGEKKASDPKPKSKTKVDKSAERDKGKNSASTVKIEKPPRPAKNSKEASTNAERKEPKKLKLPNANRVFRLWKTQDCKEQIWRLNFLDESVRKWLHDVYAKGSSLPGRQTEPCKLAKIFKRDSHDIGYDQYLQSTLPYPVKSEWLKSVVFKKNFLSRSTIPFIDLLTNLVIQSLYLPIIGDNDEDVSNESWYVDLLTNEKFMTSDLRCEIFLANIVQPSLVNEHLVLSTDLGYNLQMLPSQELFSDVYMIAEREAFEQAYTLVMENLFDDHLNLSEILRMTPCQILSSMKDYFSFLPKSSGSESTDLTLSTESEDESDGLENCGSVGNDARSTLPINEQPNKSKEVVKYVYPEPDIHSEKEDFDTIPLNSFTAFTDRLTSSTFVSKEVVVRTAIMPVALEDDVATKTRRSDESRCVFLVPTWRDGHEDTNTYAINLSHFYALAGKLNASASDVRESLKTALSSYSDTPYIMPHAARLTLTSPQMLVLLECVFRPLLRLAVPTYEVSPCLPVRPSSDPIMKLKFHNFVDKVKAYQIVPDASVSLRFIPPSRRNISLAIGKRFNNAFNYIAFIWAYPGIFALLKRLFKINPFRVSFDHARIFDYVQSLRIRKNLTLPQFVSYLRKAIEISDLLASDEMSVVRLLHYELWNNTKVFMKKELYSKDTTPRFIINPSPYVKLIYGCLIHQIETVLYDEASPFKRMFIKHLTEEQVALELREFNDDCPPGYVFVSNDFNSFEGSQPRPAQSIAFSIFFSFTEPNSLERYILNDVFYALTSYINVHGDGFDLLKCPGQMSGLESTSCGNGLLNVINSLLVMLINYLDIKAEGDDSMLRTTPSRALTLSLHSMFPCVSTTASSMFELSFCGRRLDLTGNIFVTLDEEIDKYVQFNTVLSSSMPNEQRLYDMGYMRILSLGFRYPGHPLVERCRHKFNEQFAKSGLQLSRNGIRQFQRSNWWFLRERAPALYEMLKRSYSYPAKLPELRKEDYSEIVSNTNPQLRLNETLKFRASKDSKFKFKRLIPQVTLAIGALTAVNLLVKNKYVKIGLNALSLISISGYSAYKFAQQYWKSTNPVRYAARYFTSSIPRLLNAFNDLEEASPKDLKLASVNSIPKESCLYGLNFSRSSDCLPGEDDPDLSTVSPDEGYQVLLNKIARSSHGQPVRVKEEQLDLLKEDYVLPNLSWLVWEPESTEIPYEVPEHSYFEFYPPRIKERISTQLCVSRAPAQQAQPRRTATHACGVIVASALSTCRCVCGALNKISSRIKHRNE